MTESTQVIHIIGIDASGVENLSILLQDLILSAQMIAAPRRVLELLPSWWEKQKTELPIPPLISSEKTSDLIQKIASNTKQTIILASGDPLWFGIGRLLIEKFPSKKLYFHPSPTSFQLAFAKLKRPWQDSRWISLHGRDSYPLAKLIQQRPSALTVLTDPNKEGAKEVRQFLVAFGLEEEYEFWIFEQLGHKKEKIQKILPNEELPNEINPLNLVILIRNDHQKPIKELPLFGIEDGFFKQYSDRPGLMTKREIRIQLLADLELPKKGVIWDICAGVGSIGLESLRIRPKLKLLSIDKRIGCKDLIQENASRLSVKPAAIFEANASTFLDQKKLPSDLNKPDRVILGGGGKDRCLILKKIIKALNPNGIIVIPLSTLQAINEIENILKSEKCIYKLSQHQSYRGVSLAEGTRLSPMNPVFILKGQVKK